MKFRKLFTILLLSIVLIACHQKQSHSLSLISEITMNRILIFSESKDELLSYYTFIDDENIYEMNNNADIDAVESLIYKPYALSYLFSMHGAGQKIGLTDCQDPFVTIMSSEDILDKALNAFSEEEISQGYQKAIVQETETLKNR